jgi:Bacterial inner membrane protein
VRRYVFLENNLNIFVISQILVGIAICFDLLSFQLKKRTHIVLCLSIAGTFISSHFILLEKWTAAVLMIIAVIRYIASYFTTSKKLMTFFVSASIISTFITFQGLLSILSGVGSIFQTLGAFNRNDKHLRQLMIIGTLFWLCHNFLAQSPVAVLMEILFLSSNIIGYYRFYFPKQYKVSRKT